MEKEIFDSFLGKFSNFVDTCSAIETMFQREIGPRNSDDPMKGAFWRKGALNGAFVYFLRTLEKAEGEINAMIMMTMICDHGGVEGDMDPYEYIETAVDVFDELGYPIEFPDRMKDTNKLTDDPPDDEYMGEP